MSSNVIELSGRRGRRMVAGEMGFYIRVGRNDHKIMNELLARGENRFFGLIVEAQYVKRHQELMVEAIKRQFDVVLDTKCQALGLPGGHTPSLANLPWAQDRPHRLADFEGKNGRQIAERLVDFALEHNYTQILVPTHALTGHDDPWIDVDIAMTQEIKNALSRANSDLPLLFSLAVPISNLRVRAYRLALLNKLVELPIDALWLKVDNFDAQASAAKTLAYIEAAREFQALGVPIVSDCVGGLPGLALLAFGSVGGIAHGITLYEGFNSYSWRKPSDDKGRTLPTRLYIPQLDMHFKKADGIGLLNQSPRMRAALGCADPDCCRHGVTSMDLSPGSHFVVQRSRQITQLNKAPKEVRAERFLIDQVRPVLEKVGLVKSAEKLPLDVRTRLEKKHKMMEQFQHTMEKLSIADSNADAQALMPLRLRHQSGSK